MRQRAKAVLACVVAVAVVTGMIFGLRSYIPVLSLGALYVFAGFRKVWVPRSLGGPVPISELPSKGRRRPSLTQSEVPSFESHRIPEL